MAFTSPLLSSTCSTDKTPLENLTLVSNVVRNHNREVLCTAQTGTINEENEIVTLYTYIAGKWEWEIVGFYCEDMESEMLAE